MSQKPLAPSRLALIEKCLDEGWPLSEIHATYGHAPATINRHFPGRAMPLTECAKLGWLAMKASTGTLKGKPTS